jgi:hypothetical protein
MQSVPITAKLRVQIPLMAVYVLDTTLCDKICQWLTAGRWFSPGTPVSSINKTDCYDITVESGVKHHNPNPIFDIHVHVCSSINYHINGKPDPYLWTFIWSQNNIYFYGNTAQYIKSL